MSDMDAILDGLREKAGKGWLVPLSNAEAAVHAAADARTAEIVALLEAEYAADGPERYLHEVQLIRRRFPNGGTHK